MSGGVSRVIYYVGFLEVREGLTDEPETQFRAETCLSPDLGVTT